MSSPATRAHAQEPATPQQKLVEDVLIEGNRRLRDEDVARVAAAVCEYDRKGHALA